MSDLRSSAQWFFRNWHLGVGLRELFAGGYMQRRMSPNGTGRYLNLIFRTYSHIFSFLRIESIRRVRAELRPAVSLILLAAFQFSMIAPLTPVNAQRPGRDSFSDVNSARPEGLGESEYRDGEILVGFQPGAGRQKKDEAKYKIGATGIREFSEINVHHWKLPPGRSVEQAISALSANPNVRFAEPNYIVHADQFPAAPNDKYRGELWGMHNIGQTSGTPNADINAPEAWNVTTGSPNVVIGVIDTGIDYNHPDLAANIWSNPGEIAGDGIDNDANGYIDDVRGWDFANNDNDPFDDNGHGSHVAGTIGAQGNNGLGVVGVNWQVKLMPLKFLGANGSGDTANATAAVLYAAKFKFGGVNVVRVTNNSWGGGGKSVTMQNAIESSGSVFVASAGNGATSQVQYPAGYKNANIISVAATDHNDALATFSNFSSSWVDLAAPGVNIASTYKGGYGVLSGTSMASPHVAGVAGLVLAATPGLTPASVKAAIMNSVDPVPGLAGKTVTGGRINAGRAVGSALVLTDNCGPAPCSPADIAGLSANSLTATQTTLDLSWTATGDDGASGTAYVTDIRYSTSPINAGNFAQATLVNGEPAPGIAGSTENFTVTGLRPSTNYYFAVRVGDEVGNFSGLATATGTTAAATWSVTVVDDPASNVGFYKSLKYDRTGSVPAIGYSDEGANGVKYAQWNGSGWDTKSVDVSSDTGVSLAFDSNNDPTISYGWGQLRFAQYVPSTQSWQITTLESRDANNDVTSLAYAPDGSAGISYRTTPRRGGSLKFAKRTASGWTLQTVATAGARYSSLAYDVSGRPAIAFSDDVDGDNTLDTLKLARWNGSSWAVQTVETGVAGYGVLASLVFDSAGNPTITHVAGGMVRFVRWNGSAWNPTEIVANGYNASMVFNSADGSFFVSYVESNNTIRIARRDVSGTWTNEAVDFGNSVRWIIDLAMSPCGTPSAAYSTYPNIDLKFATKCPM